MMNALEIHTAPWIVPIWIDAIKDGGVVSDGSRIVDIGKTQDLFKKFPQAYVHNHSGLLMPGMINCHIHLELSHLPEMTRPKKKGMVEWIESLLELRLHNNDEMKKKGDSVKATIKEQYDSGVGVMLNIGNDPTLFPSGRTRYPKVVSHFEIVAPNRERLSSIKKELKSLPGDIFFSPHAPYSTNTEAIKYAKDRARKQQNMISIHLAESYDENIFIETQKGPFRSFLERRGVWEDEMIEPGIYSTPVEYLNEKGILDDKTLCVHCVHVNQTDIAILKKTGAKICLCPGSNRFLDVGLPPLPDFLRAGIMPSLGTDSKCSNPEISMWKEMGNVRRYYPDIEPRTILQMATQAGAEALHLDNDYGALKRGAFAHFLEVSIDNITELKEIEIYDFLTSGKKPEGISWTGSDTK